MVVEGVGRSSLSKVPKDGEEVASRSGRSVVCVRDQRDLSKEGSRVVYSPLPLPF
jgi:hypothetical protein